MRALFSVCTLNSSLERLNADMSETDEDGAHKVSADIFQACNDLGFSPAPWAVTYWVGEAKQGTDHQDLDETPEAVSSATHSLAVNAFHLAELLGRKTYPAP